MSKKIPLKVIFVIMLVSILAGLVSIFVQSPPSAQVYWKFDDMGYEYTIHGTTNFGRGNTYYLYREKDGIRDVLLVDPKSEVDLTRFTDRPVMINGTLVRENGVDMVKINAVKFRD